MPRFRAALTWAWVVAGALSAAAVVRATEPQIEIRPTALRPGDVALLTVKGDVPYERVQGTAFGKPLAFWRSDVDGRWHALVGVSLATTPGSFTATVVATDAAGAQQRSLSLVVGAREFETRKLTVEPKFVEPPKAEAARIEREAKLLASIFAGPSSPRLWRGAFVAPVPGRATSSFGRLSVFNGQPRGRHQGADFSAAVGTPVRAPNAGRVVLAQDLYFSGNTVVLDHGQALFSLFAHLSHIEVKPGLTVAGGGLLGAAGATGRVTGPHLHWAVRLAESSVDPMALMRAVEGLDEVQP
jgi:murein DD-endopeptidase MepM/ murein hydrolase activator NlpD